MIIETMIGLNTILIVWLMWHIRKIQGTGECVHDLVHGAAQFLDRMMYDLQDEEEAEEAVYGEWKDWDETSDPYKTKEEEE
jgi:hypothetical protein